MLDTSPSPRKNTFDKGFQHLQSQLEGGREMGQRQVKVKVKISHLFILKFTVRVSGNILIYFKGQRYRDHRTHPRSSLSSEPKAREEGTLKVLADLISPA